MRILFLSTWFPGPPTHGSKLRVVNLLRQLARHHEVSLLTFADPSRRDPDAPELRGICRMIGMIPRRIFRPESLRSRLAFFHALPRSVVATYSPEMRHAVQRALTEDRYDLVIASQLLAAAHGGDFGGVPALFEEVELAVPYEAFACSRDALGRLRHRLTWMKHRRYVDGVLRNFSACTVVSAEEADLLARVIPGHPPMTIIPNGVCLSDYAGVRDSPVPGTLIFAGSFSYHANHDAMRWFLEKVYPAVLAEHPQTLLTIAGDPAGVHLPASPRVRQTGFVTDVRPLIAASWISLAPLRVGGGTRLKILESMALGTPVVATRKGAEGLDVVAGEHLLVADEPQELARNISRLLADADLRAYLAANARRLVAERYDWEIIGPRFERLVADVAGGRSAAASVGLAG